MPSISVIIPAYNAERYIAEAIESVLRQTYADYEILVVNDGSTDGTHDAVQPYLDRIRYVYQENKERSAARNAALERATGEYVAFLDADDYWLSSKLEKQVALLDRQPDLGLVFAWAEAFDANGRAMGIMGADFPLSGAEGMDGFEHLLQTCPPMLTVVARAACVREAGMFDERIRGVEDIDLWLRIALRHRIGFVPEVLARYRLSGAFMPARHAAWQEQWARPYVIKRALDLAEAQPDRQLSPATRDAALAQAYLEVALIDVALGDMRSAWPSLQKAYALYPPLFGAKSEALAQQLANFSLDLYDTFTPPDEAAAFLEAFFTQLPPDLRHLQALRAKTEELAAAGHGFRAWLQGEPALARRMFLRAICRHPKLGRNLGIWSICLQSLLATA